MKRWRVAASLIGAMALLSLGAELGLRMRGARDYPLYRPGPPLGYVPRPNQSGSFMGSRWVFNDKSMGVAEPFHPSAARDIVLIGDSLVYGGNLYDQPNKLGPTLNRDLPEARVWPIGAGSWALLNELTYLQTNPEVLAGADQLVFVTNTEDLVVPSVWRNEFTHPTRRGGSALVRVIYKLAAPYISTVEPPPTDKWREPWRALTRTGKPILVALYPTKEECQRPDLWRRNAAPLLQLAQDHVTIISVEGDKRWRCDIYRDKMHPTPAGMELLASIISSHLK